MDRTGGHVKKLLISSWALVVAGLMSSAYVSAQGGKSSLKASLDGAQEVPAVSTTGTGSLELRIDEEAATIEYELSYENLEGTTTAASHIHLGQPSVNGGVSVFLCGGGGKPACPATSGSVSGVITPADVIGPSGQGIAPGEFGEVVNALRERLMYVNVHTNKHPGGEIRGLIK